MEGAISSGDRDESTDFRGPGQSGMQPFAYARPLVPLFHMISPDTLEA